MRPTVAASSSDIRRDLVGLLPKLRRFAVTLTGDLADADVLVQSVCQRGIAKIHSWNNEGRLEGWLYGMARHQWDEMRRHRVRPAHGKGAALEQGDPVAQAQINPVEASEAHQMVTTLPEGLASVFLLVAVEHYTYQQTAEILGIPLTAVTSRLASARLQLSAMGNSRSPRRY